MEKHHFISNKKRIELINDQKIVIFKPLVCKNLSNVKKIFVLEHFTSQNNRCIVKFCQFLYLNK